MSKPLDIIEEDGKISRTGVMFLAWMLFFMTMIGFATLKSNPVKLADIPEPYVYITLVLCSTYTARRFLSDRFGKGSNPPQPTPPTAPTNY